LQLEYHIASSIAAVSFWLTHYHEYQRFQQFKGPFKDLNAVLSAS